MIFYTLMWNDEGFVETDLCSETGHWLAGDLTEVGIFFTPVFPTGPKAHAYYPNEFYWLKWDTHNMENPIRMEVEPP